MASRIWVAVAISIGVLVPPSMAVAQGAVAATLSVLAPPVERIPGAGGAAEPGFSGMNLAAGDRIRTGAGGVALITFLDGSTVTVLSDTDVTVKQATPDRGVRAIRLLLHAGRVWARVAEAAGSRSVLTLESNEYAATAHDGLIGAEQGAEGFVCWTRRGTLTIADQRGQSEAVLLAGQRAWARRGQPVTPWPFVPSTSVLEIRTSGPVLPLVQMPDARQAAGFLAGDVEVNEVFGALTEARRGSRWLVEVPAGVAGSYTLLLTGVGSGPFTVRVSQRYAGIPAHHQELRGEARPGERLFTRITQRVKGEDPRSARALEAQIDALRAWNDPGPPAIVSFPDRGQSTGTD
jgi:hypothetical protein